MANTTHPDSKKNSDQTKKSADHSASESKSQANKTQPRPETKIRNPDERADQDQSGGKRGHSR